MIQICILTRSPTELINDEWPFYDDLHSLWCELPSYNPIGVTTSSAGQDFAGHASALWNTDADTTSGVSSGVEDSNFPEDELEDELKTGDEESEDEGGQREGKKA